MNKIIEKLICTYENVLSNKICNIIIQKFENDKEIYYKNDKNSNLSILQIRSEPDPIWKEIDNIICNIISESSNHYKIHAKDIIYKFPFEDLFDDGYYIHKFYKNIGFNNVCNPFNYDKNFGSSIILFVFFLNDIEEGGELEFFNIINIKPKKGNLILFPATWDLIHKYNIPINSNNYVITGTLYHKEYHINN
tara:strand:- start:80 stop:658 length:579 start_codon:yes stop_codon:yes gene_type:complete